MHHNATDEPTVRAEGERPTHQPHITEIKQAEGFGGHCLRLDKVLQDVSRGGLDVAIVLGDGV